MADTGIEGLLAVIATIIWILFLGSVLEQYYRKRKIHQLVWAFALLLIVGVMSAEALSYFSGSWDPLVYRFYYMFAAFQVAILGNGVLYLLSSRSIIHAQNAPWLLLFFGVLWLFFGIPFSLFIDPIFILVVTIGLVVTGQSLWIIIRQKQLTGRQVAHLFLVANLLIFFVMGSVAFSALLDSEILENQLGHGIGGTGWQESIVRSFSPLFTVPGGIVLIGGAIFSYYKRQKAIKTREGSYELSKGIYNLYIALGASLLAGSGILLRFGVAGTLLLYLGNTLAVILMYFGFLESDRISMKRIVTVLTLGWLRKSSPSV